jgi:hypothetical protein
MAPSENTSMASRSSRWGLLLHRATRAGRDVGVRTAGIGMRGLGGVASRQGLESVVGGFPRETFVATVFALRAASASEGNGDEYIFNRLTRAMS